MTVLRIRIRDNKPNILRILMSVITTIFSYVFFSVISFDQNINLKIRFFSVVSTVQPFLYKN